MATGACGRCGGPNPPDAVACQWCDASLVRSDATPPSPAGYRPLDLPALPRESALTPLPTTSPWLYYRAGIPLTIIGIVVLIIAAVVAQGVASYNSTCSQIPNCTPQSDPSGGIAAFGVILLVIGLVVLGYGATRRSG